MSEVVVGEVVEASPTPSRSSKRVVEKLSEPYKGSRIRTQILSEIDERMAKGDYAFTLSTIARRNGFVPQAFISVLHDAFDNEDHELFDFASQMHERWARCEEFMYGKLLETASDKGKWEGWATGLERTRPDDWRRPSQAERKQPAINIGVVETLELVAQRRGGELTTGD
jgi:hypothetical protein